LGSDSRSGPNLVVGRMNSALLNQTVGSNSFDQQCSIVICHPDAVPMQVIANIPNQARSQRVGNDIPRNLANILILPGSTVVIGSLPKTPMLTQVAIDGAC